MLVSLEAPAKGINELQSIYKLDPLEAQELRNVDIDSTLGLISSRGLAQEMSIGAITGANPILAVHIHEMASGAWYMIAFDGTKIFASLSGTGAWSNINSGKLLTASKPLPTFLSIDDSLWVFNGYDAVAQWKDASTYRYLDGSATAGTGTVSTTNDGGFTVLSGVGTSFVTELAVGDVVIVGGVERMITVISSATVARLDSDPDTPWVGASFQIRKTPNVPKAEHAIYDKNRVVCSRVDTNALAVRMSITTYGGIFIKPDNAKAWPATEELIAPAAFGAKITGMGVTKGLLTQSGVAQGKIILFKDSSCYTLSGLTGASVTTITDATNQPRFDILSNSIGTRYKKSICSLGDGTLAFAAELGLYKTNGVELDRFSDKINNTYLELSRIRSTAQSITFSKNFNDFTFSSTESTFGVVQLSGSNLTGTAESDTFQLVTQTAGEFLNTLLQYYDDGSTVLIELKVAATEGGLAAATYAALTDQDVPTDALNIWGQVRITLTRADTTTNPTVTFVQLNYTEYATLSREPYMIYNSDEILFGMDTEYENIRLSLNRNGAWTIDDDEISEVLFGCGTRFQGVIYLGGGDGIVYQLYADQGDDDTLDVEASWLTKPVTTQYPNLTKSLQYMIVYSEGDPFKQMDVDFIVDGTLRITRTFTIYEDSLRETKLWLPQGVLFKTLELRFRAANKQRISKIGRVDLGIELVEKPTKIEVGG